jgi:hypothetical protein
LRDQLRRLKRRFDIAASQVPYPLSVLADIASGPGNQRPALPRS